MIGRLWGLVDRWRRNRRWHKDPRAYLAGMGVRVGTGCRIFGIPEEVFGSEPYLCRLGDHVTITSGVKFISHDGGVWVFRDQYPDLDVFAPITVGNNVFIGINAIIMPGVNIGDNVVIGSGSVVTRDIAANSVAAGVPARVVRSLDDYQAKALARGLHLRSLAPDRLRAELNQHFGLGL